MSERGSKTGRDAIDAASSRIKLVEIRCNFAELAQREAGAAEARAVKASRSYNTQLAALKSAQAANPGAVRRLKEEAHRTFRRAVFAAKTHVQVEEAATIWLAAINRINATSRTALIRLHREREAVEGLAAEMDYLTAQAEAARAVAEAAAEACRAARESLDSTPGAASAAASADAARTALTEFAAAQATAHAAFATPLGIGEPTASPGLRPVSISRSIPGVGVVVGGSAEAASTASPASPAESAEAVNYRTADPPAIVGLLRGEAGAMTRLVEKLGGSDLEQRGRWLASLEELVDAIVNAAVDQGYFVFPRDHPFWGQFTLEQSRELARGLAALGFRYDGRDGFADDRAPGPRDLTLAAGNAGLTTVRVRYWPSVEEAALLYRDVGVDATAVLVEHAPAATMGQLVQLIGRRAETMSDIWNDWPRVRPLLLGSSRD